jgi:2-oxoisovalerate dehydrogenase E1 component
MVLSRRLDDREIELKKRNEIYFQISGAGHEAINVAVGYLLKPAHDWFYPYYRDRALMLQLGMTAAEVLYEAVGAEDDPNSHGRQMPCHWGDRRTNVVSQSSPTGTQFLQAVGCAQAGRYIGGRGLNLPAKADEIVHCSSGDGTTNQGDFHEALSQACIDNLPVLFIIEDNGYAISVPSERHTPGGDIAAMVSGYAGLTTLKVDGRDLIACLEALAPVIAKMRSREIGPVLVVASVTRPYSHSLSDDHAMYRPKAELDAEAASDCLNISRQRLIKEFGATEAEVSAVEKEADEEARDAAKKAIAAAKPDPADAMVGLYAT